LNWYSEKCLSAKRPGAANVFSIVFELIRRSHTTAKEYRHKRDGYVSTDDLLLISVKFGCSSLLNIVMLHKLIAYIVPPPRKGNGKLLFVPDYPLCWSEILITYLLIKLNRHICTYFKQKKQLLEWHLQNLWW